ncbi:MAG: hypothetical protein CVT59_10325 [Actinobacteria bacterium HGW-Actinobacteria-1]|jgi:hypothetical protein|nr:MAG: hypothetical protein CVT59_10325 [Actinobacteria bacterium HGW-Actinobacteria-1]
MKTLRIVLMVSALVVLLAAAASTPTGYAHAAPAQRAPYMAGEALIGAAHGARDTVSARAELAALAARYRYLDDVSVTVGSAPEGKEAVAYYTSGRIVIDSAHTVSVETILAHEVWHIIDWRDNGRLDWGEYLPPAETDMYLKR